MQNESPFRAAIEQMEEHEIIERLKKGMFNDEARPVAEDILRNRGIDPGNPIIPEGQRPPVASARSRTPRLLPAIFAAFAGGMAGRHIGAAFAGSIGVGIAAAAFAWGGWWTGAKLALQIRKINSKPGRFLVSVVAILAWLFAMGLVGIFAQTSSGRIRP